MAVVTSCAIKELRFFSLLSTMNYLEEALKHLDEDLKKSEGKRKVKVQQQDENDMYYSLY